MIRLVARTDHNAAEPVRVINQQVLDGGGVHRKRSRYFLFGLGEKYGFLKNCMQTLCFYGHSTNSINLCLFLF